MYYGQIPDRRHRFIDFVGDGFMVGLVSSSAFHFVSGLRGAPSGRRLASGAQAVLAKAPRFAGWLGAYSALLFSVETAMSLARRREDDFNSIAAGAVSMALQDVRRGARTTALFAFIGAGTVVLPLGLCWFVARSHVTQPYVQMYFDSRSAKAPRSTAPSNTYL